MVSHVMLILSETNPIICAVSEPNTEEHQGGYCSPRPRVKSQELPVLHDMLTQGRKWATRGIRFYQGTLRLQGSGWSGKKNEKCSRHWSQIWAWRCANGAWTFCGRKGRELSYINVSKEDKMQLRWCLSPTLHLQRLSFYLYGMRLSPH